MLDLMSFVSWTVQESDFHPLLYSHKFYNEIETKLTTVLKKEASKTRYDVLFYK
jgi:hypothetical protein